MGPVTIAVQRDRAWRALAIVAAAASGVATSSGGATARGEARCAMRGFVPAPRAPEHRRCDELEQGCFLFDHPGYYELHDWLGPHAPGFFFRSNAVDLDGDGKVDCFTAILTTAGWTVLARRAQVSCVQGPTFHPPAPYVMSRALHAAAGPTAGA